MRTGIVILVALLISNGCLYNTEESITIDKNISELTVFEEVQVSLGDCLLIEDSLETFQFLDSMCSIRPVEPQTFKSFLSLELQALGSGPTKDGSSPDELIRDYLCLNDREMVQGLELGSFMVVDSLSGCCLYRIERSYPESEYGVDFRIGREEGRLCIVDIEIIG